MVRSAVDKRAQQLAQRLVQGESDAASELLEHFETEAFNAESEQFLLGVLQDSKLPTNVMEKLLDTTWWEALIALSRNPSLPEQMLWQIAQSNGTGIYQNEVQQSLVVYEKVPLELQEGLLQGTFPAMWSHLDTDDRERRKRSLLAAAKEDPGSTASTTMGALARSDGQLKEAKSFWEKGFGAPPRGATKDRTSIEDLSSNQMYDYALSPFTSSVTLWALGFTEDTDVESRIAANPATPPCLVAYFAESLVSNLEPLSLAWANPVIPAYVWGTIEQLCRKGSQTDETDLALQTAASNHGLPISTMEALAQSTDEEVRRAVAANLSTPLELLDSLAHDSKSGVRRAARSNPNATNEA